MPETRPLATLLSHVLIAWTIEIDNEAEQRMAHRTTVGGDAGEAERAPWLVSLALWANFMQYVDADGVSIRDFRRRARLSKEALRFWLVRMSKWWGYIAIAPDPNDLRAEPPRAEWLVRPTSGGLRAQAAWRAALEIVEDRWRARFGAAEISSLRASLHAIVWKFDRDLPDYLPILQYGLITSVYTDSTVAAIARPERGTAATPTITLLANVLLAFALEFDTEAELSLAIGANVLRVVAESGTLQRDLPALAGVSKEAIAMALTFLCNGEYAVVESDSEKPRDTFVRLTAKGEIARRDYANVLESTERRWQAQFGEQTIAKLRAELAALCDRADTAGPLLARGLQPNPTGWRARKPYLKATEALLRDPRASLPHFPMVLHRGGWPDGS